MEAARKQAPRAARPAARYWKGKAPKGVAEVDSDSEEEDVQQQEPLEDGDVPISGDQDFGDEEEEEAEDIPLRTDTRTNIKSMNVTLRDVNISKDGKVIVAGREESGKTEAEQEEESEEEDEEDEEKPGAPGAESGSEEESSEYESSSEEEEAKPLQQFRPVFVPKRARATIAERDAMAQDTEEALKKKEEEAEERKKQSHDLVAESIRRELAEKEKEEDVIEVDDTDGLDPEAEFEAWRLRELARIKKEKEDEMQRELEREEVERRRAMPEEQRMKEDLEHAQKLREEKPKGQQKFLQKYWHKGAFHQDDEILQRRDYTEATESAVDVSLLPKVMQVRNFGKRSRTKYTHLVDQDTTAGNGGFGGAGSVKSGGKSTDAGGCFNCGGPHLKKDCPNLTGPLTERGGTGANGAPSGPRRWGDKAEGSSWKDRDDRSDTRNGGWKTGRDDGPRRREDRYRDRSRERDYDRRDYRDKRDSRRRSRSRSPRRSKSPRYRRDDYRNERRRSRERSVEDYREKRRRLD